MNTNPSKIEGDSLPVNTVPFIDAIKYCNARSEAEGFDGFYTIDSTNTVHINPNSNGYRLPTEYEWAMASRKDGRTKTQYAGGNNLKKIAWYGGNSNRTLHRVMYKLPNSRGIYDMNGNVEEWLWSKSFYNFNVSIGRGFMHYIDFDEHTAFGNDCISEDNGFRVVLVRTKETNLNVKSIPSVKYYEKKYFSVYKIYTY